MSEIDRMKVVSAMEDVNRAMSMLSLVISALRQEDAFQDAHINRPIVAETFIPTMGEMADAVLACQYLLHSCWQDLARNEDRI